MMVNDRSNPGMLQLEVAWNLQSLAEASQGQPGRMLGRFAFSEVSRLGAEEGQLAIQRGPEKSRGS